MSNKQSAVDILFEEIKESQAVMPKALFTYFEMVYNKVKEIEKENLRDAYEADVDLEFYSIIDKKFEKYYKKTYGK